MELAGEKPKDNSRLFGVPKDVVEKQQPNLDARWANCHFIEPEYPELFHHRLLMQLENLEHEELFVGKLEIDNLSRCLCLPKHLRKFSELPQIHTGKDKEMWRRGLATIPIG